MKGDPIRDSLTDEQIAVIESGELTGEAREAFISTFAESFGCSPERATNLLLHLEAGDTVHAAEQLWHRNRGPSNRAARRRRKRRK